MKKKSTSSSAEKRVLWEIRQRYKISRPAGSLSARPVKPNHPASTTAVRKQKRKIRSEAGSPWTSSRGARRAGRGFKKTRRWTLNLALLVVIIMFVTGGVFGFKILAAGNKITTTERSILGQLKDLLFSQGAILNGERDGRVNIMLLAVGGEGHSGENLADTIMIASIRLEDGKIALLSIPRDLYVQVPGESYFSKINAVHAYGESQKKEDGPAVLRQVVEEITGLPIHYFARVDFTAFKQIVDAVGGVDIRIDRDFFDFWHKIDFFAGTEHMDGERALAYVRARYIEGPEGGDFKRAARQQQALLSIQNKVFSVNTAFDFGRLNSILTSVSDNVRTDMQLWELKRIYEMARTVDQEGVHSVVLTTGPTGVLVGTTEILGDTPASVLKTRTGNYSEIHTLAQSLFDSDAGGSNATPQVSATPTPQEKKVVAKPTVEIRNGTNITGLAKKTSDDLIEQDYEVLSIGNAIDRSTLKTTVYALDSIYIDRAKELAEILGAETDSGLPSEEASSEADVLVILGAKAGS